MIVFSMTFLSWACLPPPNPHATAEETNCQSNTAQILVGDGFLRVLCGCTAANETSGTNFWSPNTLTCHLASNNTMVYFTFVGAALTHQIAFTGPIYAASALYDPSGGSPPTFPILLTEAGTTYNFKDTFYPALTGQIIVP